MKRKLREYWYYSGSARTWLLGETDVKINGKWAYLYRAIEGRGNTLDFYRLPRRNSQAAYRFLSKLLNRMKKRPVPKVINTDKAASYGRVITLLKREGKCPPYVEHRQIKYRNNVIEYNPGKLKRIINPTLGFKSLKTAHVTIKGIEATWALRKDQADSFYYSQPLGEVRLVNKVFGL